MLLTLTPPSDYLVPTILHTHTLSVPQLPSIKTLKVPPVYTKAKQRLNDAGLALPNYLAIDRALWWHYVIERVEWNLDRGEVIVLLTDGSEERWSLGGNKSNEILSDDDEDTEMAEEGKSRGKERLSSSSSSSSLDLKSRWSPEVILARLRTFSIELRSAYEDITSVSHLDAQAPHLVSDEHFRTLIDLAEKPSRKVPHEWIRDKSTYSYFVDEDSQDELEEAIVLNEQGEADEQPRSGQFKSRRRPTRLSVPYENAPTPPSPLESSSSTPQPHDFLSFVHLLTQIRTYLLDLLPSTIYPQLIEVIGPTYSLWSTETAISWCRRKAIEKGREAGIIVLELLDDDPEAVLESTTLISDPEDSSFESDILLEDSSGGEESWGIEIRDTRNDSSSNWSDFVKMDKKRNDIPLNLMREDFKLRCWAEDAIERQRAMEREQWQEKLSQPRWLHEPEPWEVSRPINDDFESSDSEVPFMRRNNKNLSTPFSVPRSSKFSRSPPQTLTSPPRAFRDGDILVSTPALSPSTSSSSSEYDSFSDPSSEPDSTTYSDYFYLEDHLGEEFLPSKLPKAVVTPSSSRGKEMEKARALLHAKLNEIAGFERKIRDLQEFSAEELGSWEDSISVQRGKSLHFPFRLDLPFVNKLIDHLSLRLEIKDQYSQSESGLRKPGASSTSPPPTPRRKTVLPIKAQPLLHQTADNVLTSKLARAMETLEPRANVRKETYDTIQKKISPNNKKRKILATPKPRKRQKFNLETLDQVKALEKRIRRDSKNVGTGGGKGTLRLVRKNSALTDRTSRANGVRGVSVGQSTSKSKRGKPLRREASQINLESFVSQNPPPSTQTNPSASRLTLLELARRRPPPPQLSPADESILPASLETEEVIDPLSFEDHFISSSKTFSQLEMDEELTDTEEEVEPETDHFVLNFENSNNHDGEDLVEAIELSPPVPYPGSSSNLTNSFVPSSQLLASALPQNHSPILNFPLSNSRNDTFSTSSRPILPAPPSSPDSPRVPPFHPSSPVSPIRPTLSRSRRSSSSITPCETSSSPITSRYFASRPDQTPGSPSKSIRLLETLSLITGAAEANAIESRAEEEMEVAKIIEGQQKQE